MHMMCSTSLVAAENFVQHCSYRRISAATVQQIWDDVDMLISTGHLKLKQINLLLTLLSSIAPLTHEHRTITPMLRRDKV